MTWKARWRAPDRRLPLNQTLRIADQVCRVLEHAHGQSVIHRDLKPSNVWLTGDGTARLGDFGLTIAFGHLAKQLGAQTDIRITIIAPDGTVLGDSEADPATAENHLNRPKVQEAIRKGQGKSDRRAPAPPWHARPRVPRSLCRPSRENGPG